MLGQLHIKNIGIIDDLTINFEDGLNILTGETGAGKSLIIDAINVITGSRLSKDIIKHGETEAFVEACFFGDEDTILTREFYQNGRNICKINGNMVTLSHFKEVGEMLIDIHGQHDNQYLLNEKTHIKLLDNFAGSKLSKLLHNYTELLVEYKNIKAKLKSHYGNPIERARRLDLLKYQMEEIQNSHLRVGEEEELSSKRSLMMNAEKIAKALGQSSCLVDDTAIVAMEGAIREMNGISSLDEKYQSILTSLNDAYYSLKDASYEIASSLEDTSFCEEEQTQIEERLDTIYSLKRKYGNSVETILQYGAEIQKEIDTLENSDEEIAKLQQKASELEKELINIAKIIRDIRKKTAKTIEKEINQQLQDLEMKNAYIEFDFKESATFFENGMDIIQILICTNLGEGLKPLSKIASGGEISRVMLAIKTVLCAYDNVPTMIFDEIDTGISGQAAVSVAEKMKIIGKTHQVICVTHLSSIAASGDVNFYIEKVVENGRTKTKITKLSEEGTIKEIARILAGNDITKAVLAHAKEMRKAM